jgi:hypothetical protein
MSDQLFEVAFSGQVIEDANLDEVKAKVGRMFNADDAKLAQLFSGKRVVIKKNIDRATAAKYETALHRAGAQCEVAPMGGDAAGQPSPAPAAEKPAATAKPAAAVQIETSYDGEVPPPPQLDPLGITADEIEDLSATIAPVGSELRDDYEEVATPEFDLDGLEIAPVGSSLGSPPKKPDPPPPDTTGITLADE